MSRKQDSLVINTAEVPDSPDNTPESEALLEVDESLDQSASALAPDLDDAPRSIRAEKVARNVKKLGETTKMSPYESARLLVEGLRRAKIPARMVYGIQWAEEGVSPNYWAQYHRDEGWVDLDPSRVTLLPSTQQIQLAVEPMVTKEVFEADLPKISITRVTIDSGTEADFN